MTGGHVWQGGHAWQGGMHGRGHIWQGACMAGGHVWQGGHAWQGDMCAGQTATEAGGTHPTGMHSYWKYLCTAD